MSHKQNPKSARIDELNRQLTTLKQESSRRKKERDALMAGSKAVLAQTGFDESARAIFEYCRDLIGAASGYVALLSDDGYENEVLFLEAGGMPCSVNPELPMPIRGLRAEAYEQNKTVYDNDFMNSEWMAFMPKGHVVLNNVMFAPLVLEGKTVGIMGLANKETGFTDNDAKMASGFGELAAIALQNSRNLDQVKTLKGLLPICSHCKKIRDDSGYWNRIDTYIQEHSDAIFSHGICDACLKKNYPEYSD